MNQDCVGNHWYPVGHRSTVIMRGYAIRRHPIHFLASIGSTRRKEIMQKTIRLSPLRSLRVGISKPKLPTKNWLVFLPESGARYHKGTRNEFKILVNSPLADEFNYMVINKPGLTPRRKNLEKFYKSFRRKTRVRDAVFTLKKVIPKGHQVFLVGYSEGAYLAPEIAVEAAKLKVNIKTVIMIGGGTRGWLKEEIAMADRYQRPAVKEKVLEINRNPNSMKMWNGFPYATWYSYRRDHTLAAIKKVRVPMLSILGKKDNIVDIKTTLKDLRNLSRKTRRIQTLVLTRCGHSFEGHWPQVRTTLKWYLSQFWP